MNFKKENKILEEYDIPAGLYIEAVPYKKLLVTLCFLTSSFSIWLHNHQKFKNIGKL